jgi:hypothetical protein
LEKIWEFITSSCGKVHRSLWGSHWTIFVNKNSF